MGQRESTDKEANKVEKKISNSNVQIRASDSKLEKKIRSTSADKAPLAKSEGANNEPNLRRSNPGSSNGTNISLSSSGSSLNLSNSSNPNIPTKKESMLRISEGDIEKLQFVDFHDLQLIKILGEGSYGLVYLARWRNFNVAYKQLKNIDLEKIDEMTREAKIMFSMPSHPNVLQLFAIVLDGGNPLGMITEYLELGSLKDLLCGKQVKLTFQEIVKIAKDIAKGMQHLQDNRIVHRDLSARNILVSEEKGTWLCKVADFGLSRSLDQFQSKGQTKSNVGPLKWMAPESLIYKQYSFRSDVWSYGATLIEVLDKGNDPYPNLDGVQAASLVMHKDAKPSVPENTPAKLEELLNQCFSRAPEKRPDFASILKVLDEVQEDIESNPFYAF